MALETLKDVNEIGGFEVGRFENVNNLLDVVNAFEKHIVVDDESNTIAFRIQKGPIKEVGVNGCQVDTLIHAAMLIIKGLNDNFPCIENNMAIEKLENALFWLMKRRMDREMRNVEGTNQL